MRHQLRPGDVHAVLTSKLVLCNVYRYNQAVCLTKNRASTLAAYRHMTISHMRKCTRNLHDNAILFICLKDQSTEQSPMERPYLSYNNRAGSHVLPSSHGIDTVCESERGRGCSTDRLGGNCGESASKRISSSTNIILYMLGFCCNTLAMNRRFSFYPCLQGWTTRARACADPLHLSDVGTGATGQGCLVKMSYCGTCVEFEGVCSCCSGLHSVVVEHRL